jgi:hypothetical protein
VIQPKGWIAGIVFRFESTWNRPKVGLYRCRPRVATATVGFAAIVIACGADPGANDAVRYAQAAGAPTENCVLIANKELREECVALGARSIDECDRLEGSVWRDECAFQVCDLQELEGEQLRACCRRAGAFERQCVGHGARRSAARVLDGIGPGDEARALSAVEAAMRRELGQAAGSRAENLVAEWLADRPGEFSAAVCGSAQPEICAKAYQVRLFRSLEGEAARRACGREVSQARAQSLGAPPWSSEMDGVVALAWREVCRRKGR